MAILEKVQAKGLAGYKGKQARTGNSLGLRFERALFQSHPEFSGCVRAHVIAPGRMLVVAEPVGKAKRDDDPVMESFLSFLATDIANNPSQIKPLDRALMDRIDALVGHIEVNRDEDLGDEALI
jgi:antitoxin PrlF